jgi:vacuolar-type H+-ATPase subunit F/Vma7
MSSDIAILGKESTVMPFLATGARVIYAKEGEAKTKMSELIEQGIKIIFFTDDFADELSETLWQYRTEAIPCLIPIPTGRGKTRIAIERIRGIIKKAVGADIFLEEE